MLWHSHKVNTFKKLTDAKEFKTILDVGCAAGTITNKISQMFPQSKVVGTDVYQKAVKLGQKLYPHIQFIQADAHQLPFRASSFDLVYCCETIEHVQDPN